MARSSRTARSSCAAARSYRLPPASLPATAGNVIDAKGMSAMPGFIDAHRHIRSAEVDQARCSSCWRPGSPPCSTAAALPSGRSRCATRSSAGQINGPRLIPSGNTAQLAKLTPDAARAEIRKLAQLGVQYTGEMLLTPVPGPECKGNGSAARHARRGPQGRRRGAGPRHQHAGDDGCGESPA